jgi:hypothetical protein
VTFDGNNATLADRLEHEKREVEQLGFALRLMTPRGHEVDEMVHRINAWIDEACEALRKTPELVHKPSE